MTKLMFFLGKGGVGKTTMAVASSAALAAIGLKVLVASLDPAHNLGDVLGIRLDGNPRSALPGMDALEVDVPYWINRYLEQSREEIRANYAYNLGLNLDSFLNILRLAPGSEEYAVLWAIEHLYCARGREYDVIVFDTPPTALTLRLLAMPALSAAWVEELASMRRLILGKRQILLKINPEAGVLRGATVKERDRVYGKLSGIRERLQSLNRLFRHESFIAVVMNPDSLSLAESIRIREELAGLEIRVNSVCLNKASADGSHLAGIHRAFPGCPIMPVDFLPEGITRADDLRRLDVSALLKQFSIA